MLRFRAYLPALLLLLFSTWCGTFDGAAYGVRTVTGHLALLAVLAAAGDADPLRLSRRGNLLLGLLLLVFVLSLVLSPVPRAGRMGLLLVPAYLMVPPFVERCWPDAEARQRGLLALAATVGAVAIAALAGAWRHDAAAALPLGHHNLLAAWLVALLPVAVLPWRDGGTARFVSGAAGLLAVVALLATRSLSGLGALGVMVAAAVLTACRQAPCRQAPCRRAPCRRRAALLAAVVLLGLAVAGRSRLRSVVTGADLSVAARAGYLAAAARGVAERPLLGWGPGSASWTLGRFLQPRPGVHPPDQVVSDPHSLPFRLAYENGLLGLGLVAALGLAVLRTRWRDRDGDAGLRLAAFHGLLGWGVVSLAGRPLAAPALPLTALLLVGLLQASSRAGGSRSAKPGNRRGWVVLALFLALFLAPADVAHLAYDRAATTPDPTLRAKDLRRAIRLDPGFPLYPARLALIRSASASDARLAAERAWGVAHFHLLTGVLERDEGKARNALLEACDLNPLGALAPFHLAVSANEDPRAPIWAARALLADPILLAAEALQRRPQLIEAALAELRRIDTVDPAWVLGLAESFERVRHAAGPTRRLVLELDAEGAIALSLHVFRRRPWPAHLDEVRVFADALPDISVRAASRSRTTDVRLFQAPECGLPGPQRDAP